MQFPRPASLSFGLRAALVAGAVVVSATAAGQPDAAGLEPCADEIQMVEVVDRLNALRRQSAPCAPSTGAMQKLSWQPLLASSAVAQARDLALRDRLSHFDAANRGLGARLRSVGYAAAGAGENLAAGQHDMGDTLAAWLASPTHCANLMQPEFRDVGLACVQRRGSRYERFWVAHFGVPASTLAAARR